MFMVAEVVAAAKGAPIRIGAGPARSGDAILANNLPAYLLVIELFSDAMFVDEPLCDNLVVRKVSP